MLSLGLVLAPVEEGKDGGALHQTGGRVAKEPASGLESAIDADVVIGDHVEVARLGGVVRGLLGDVVGAGTVGQIPVAGEDFSEDGVEWLLDSSVESSQQSA